MYSISILYRAEFSIVVSLVVQFLVRFLPSATLVPLLGKLQSTRP